MRCQDCGEHDILIAWRDPFIVCVACARHRCDRCHSKLNSSNRHVWTCGCGWWTPVRDL